MERNSTRQEALNEEIRKYQAMYEDADYEILRLRRERDNCNFDQLKRFGELTSAINEQSVKRETAKKQLEYIRSITISNRYVPR